MHMRFRLAPRSMTLDNLEMLVRIFGEFRVITQICEATANNGYINADTIMDT